MTPVGLAYAELRKRISTYLKIILLVDHHHFYKGGWKMTNKYRLMAIPIIVVMVLVLCRPVVTTAAEFSADLIRSGGGDKMTSKVFIKGDLRREEIMDDGEMGVVNISRPDKGVTWNLMPDERMYMEMPLEDMEIGTMEDIENLESSGKMQSLGKETVNGYVCEKRRFDEKAEGSVIVWYSSKLHSWVKIQIIASGGEGDMVMEYRNIKVGKVPDSKFEIPDGYEKFSIPGMPGGMMPGGMTQGMPQ